MLGYTDTARTVIKTISCIPGRDFLLTSISSVLEQTGFSSPVHASSYLHSDGARTPLAARLLDSWPLVKLPLHPSNP